MLDDFIAELNASNALKYTEGEFELMGMRGVVMPMPTMHKMLQEALEADNLEEALHETGRFQGRLSIRVVGKNHDLGREEYIQRVIKSGNVMGMGKMELKAFDPETSLLIVAIERLPSEKDIEGEKVLEFWKGAFKAIGNQIFDSETSVTHEEASSGYLLRCSA